MPNGWRSPLIILAKAQFMSNKYHNHVKRGFTLIELLVVIVIIGILATLATVALGSARMKARDARRISDVKQIQTALELFYNSANMYPTTITAGSAIANGTDTYMAKVPNNPTPANDTNCGTLPVFSSSGAGSITYVYSALPTTGPTSYTIVYCLGGLTGNLAAGTQTAQPGSTGSSISN